MMAASSLNGPSKLLMAAAIVAMVIACTFSASAQTDPGAQDPIVFGPDPANPGQGDIFSCTGGPPFTVPAPPGNCAFVTFGAQPAGLVCDIPTTVFFLNNPGRSEPAFLCHAPTTTTPAATPPPAASPTAPSKEVTVGQGVEPHSGTVKITNDVSNQPG